MTRIVSAVVNGHHKFRVYKFQQLVATFETMEAAKNYVHMEESVQLFNQLFKSFQNELFRCNHTFHNKCKAKLIDLGEL
jgi:hypothetical protein